MNQIDMSTPQGAALGLLPEILLTGWSLVVLLVASWRHGTPADSRLAGWLSFAGVVLSAAGLGWLWVNDAGPVGLAQMIALDPFRYAALALVLLSAGATILLSLGYLERERLLAPEYYPLILLATSGMMFLSGAEDLVVLFLGLEVMSVAVYVLAGYDRANPSSAEAALKYFLIGAFASGFLLYGIALIYGATGTTNLSLIGAQLAGGELSLMAALGLGLLLIGLGFKVAAVPFHMWAPDVYDGSPTPVTGFMATGVKVAGFVALVRVLVEAFPSATEVWQPVIFWLAVASMVVGNLIALAQRTLKRMLAYSSIAHAGYLLAAVWPGSRMAAGAVLLYLAAYVLTTLASFGFLAALGRGGERDVTYEDIAGLAGRRPWIALGLCICMLSLLGFPGTFGFIGKWNILMAVVAERQVALAVVLVVTSVISAGYYLPVIMAMYMKPSAGEDSHAEVRLWPAAAGAIAVSVIAVLLFGIWPGRVLDLAGRSASTLTQTGTPVAREAMNGQQ
ncbi:MAG TPA: NADH-quinone oxidoreductase subunit N [Gemmatimonadales bacterium]|nr:NADH-quinone oxidoreductase subunit N [Gemmatimonadales bacterium]